MQVILENKIKEQFLGLPVGAIIILIPKLHK